MLLHPSSNFEIKIYYQNKPKFNGVSSRNNLSEIKDRAYLINLDEYKSVGTYSIVLHANGDNPLCFDTFGVKHISKEIKTFIDKINIITKICIIQTNDAIKCKYQCVGFINFKLKDRKILDYTNLFSPNYYGRNCKIVLKDFQ